ncbi:MAG: polysulfide reductase NrfD [SAR324 cluster bacterium]|nr:polysulfide reductase NrfD [SAR324 cluster bacterium]
MRLINFFWDVGLSVFRGGKLYFALLTVFGLVALLGFFSYIKQYQLGIMGHGLGEEVSWGVYIANFTFLVGVAAAAVMLVIPAYIFNIKRIKEVVLLGEVMALTACIMCVLFILVSLGRPERLWHILPFLGKLNLPTSMLAWDVIVINSYLILNLLIPLYMLYIKYCGEEPNFKIYFPATLVSILFAISIHTVTAFLFSSNVSRPFWNTAILGPRFLASAFTSGPAILIIAFQMIRAKSTYWIDDGVIKILALITTVALQINMFLLAVELFTEFYRQTDHGASAQYLFFGLDGHNQLVPWIWTAIALNTIALLILSVHKLRESPRFLNTACVLTVFGIWIEKGMGLVIPGLIPSPLGDIVEYTPSIYEIGVSVGIWSIGGMIFLVLAKIVIGVEKGRIKYIPR